MEAVFCSKKRSRNELQVYRQCCCPAGESSLFFPDDDFILVGDSYRSLSSSHLEDPLVVDLRNNLLTVQYLRGWSCSARLEDLEINRMLSLVLCWLSWSSWYSPSWRLEAVIPEDWVDSWIWWVIFEVCVTALKRPQVSQFGSSINVSSV